MAPEKRRDLATTLTIIAAMAMLVVAIFQYYSSTKWNNVENYMRVSVLESKVTTVENNVTEIKTGIDEIKTNQTEMLLMLNDNYSNPNRTRRGGFNRNTSRGIR